MDMTLFIDLLISAVNKRDIPLLMQHHRAQPSTVFGLVPRILYQSSGNPRGSREAVVLSSPRKLRLNDCLHSWVRFHFVFPYTLHSFSCLETAPSERPQLFIRKLHQCRVLFDFNDASSELKGKQIKAQTLHEMLEYITTQRGVITESVYPEVVNMVGHSHSVQLCQAHAGFSSLLPTSSDLYPRL